MTGYGPRVAAPWRSVRTFLAGEMTGRCGSGQAEAPGDGGARVGAVYVASGITRALVSAQTNRARMVRSACNQPARSVGPAAAAAPLVLGPAVLPLECATQAVELLPQRGSRDQGVQRPAPIHRLAEEHSAVRQHPLGCPVVTSEPANVHSPCSHVGGLCLPALTAGVSRSGMTGRQSRCSLLVDHLVVIAHVEHGNLRAEPSRLHRISSGTAKLDSAALAVSIRHASGRLVSAHTARWSL